MKTNSSLFVNLDFSVSNPFHLNQSPGTESRSYCTVLVVMTVSQSLSINSGKKYNTNWVLCCLKVSVNLRVFFIYIFCSLFSNFRLLVALAVWKKNRYYLIRIT